MNIHFNNQPQQIQDSTALQLFLDQLVGEKQKGIAVAINDIVIPRLHWATHILKPDDAILVITATQGG